MPSRIEEIHTADDDPKWNMPYTPALKVSGGALLWISGVTAAPVYHSHPHVTEEFDGIPPDAGEQAVKAFDNLENILKGAGAGLDRVVQLFRFIVDIDSNQDAINAVQKQRMGHRNSSTTVEVVRLATDPRLVLELTAVAAVDE
jgi:enamine deaminase RidA (YjgF/YER057c/UK114 family)